MITSPSNGRIKLIRELMAHSKARKKEGVFVAEGVKMFLEAPENEIREVYLTERLYTRLKFEKELPKKYEDCRLKLKEVSYEVVADDIFERISDTVTPQGILAIIDRREYQLEDILGGRMNAIYMVLENLQDPGNLGTILRTAEASGVDGVILGENCVDMYNPKVIRSTMGAIFRVPFTYVENVREAIRIMSERGISTYAAILSEDAKEYDAFDYTTATAFVIGNEGNGLSEEAIRLSTSQVFIPMQGEAESLNASMAAGILMYEAARQRRHKEKQQKRIFSTQTMPEIK